MRQFLVLGWMTCCACAVSVIAAAPAARAADALTDYDKRAAAALYTAKGGKDVDPATMNEAAMKGLTRWTKDATKKTALYILEFGGVQNGVDSRGMYRVGVGEDLPAPGEGWKPIANKPKEAGEAEVFFKQVESSADKFNDIGVRRKIGGVTLLVRQRHPLSVPVDAAAKGVAQRYAQFVDIATRYRLLMGRIRLLYMSSDVQPDVFTDGFKFSLSDSGQTELVFKAMVVDEQGNPMTNIKKMSFKLTGRLASIAKVKVAGRMIDKPTQKFDVDDPKGSVDLVVVLPKNDPSLVQQNFDQYGKGDKGEPPLGFKCAVALK